MHGAWFTKPSQSIKSTRRTGSLVFERLSGWSATLFSHCAGMKLLSEKLWKRSQGRLKEDNPLGGVLFYKSEDLICCVRTCYDSVSHTSNSTVTNCTEGTLERTDDEGLNANIWCFSASAFCQTGDNNVKSWNSPIVPLSEGNSAGWAGQPRTLWPRGAARKRRRGRWDVRVRFPA